MRPYTRRTAPPIAYHTSARRPGWVELPAEVRAAIETRLGSAVIQVASTTGGFTRGFASVLETASGERVFVKAASLAEQPHLCDWYAREAAVTAALPPAVPAPRFRWSMTAAGYFVSCFTAIDGRVPRLPWVAAELDAALAAYTAAAVALCDPPAELLAIGLPRLADLARTDLSGWQEVAAGGVAVPGCPPQWLSELVALEEALPGLVESNAAIHCDLRVDNILVDRTGLAWICDWTWVCHGPAWFDLVELLVIAYADGLDADSLFANHAVGGTAPADGLDAALAALSGYWLTSAGSMDPSSYLRRHRQWSGAVALTWLAERRGWR